MKLRALNIAASLILAAPLALTQQASPKPPDIKPATPLTGTHWTLTQLNGESIKSESGHNDAWIELNAESKRLAGSGGCNRLMGSYELEGSTLRFRQVASTMMACPGETMPREQSFLKALSATTTFRIRGSTLILRSEDSAELARLTAQAAKPAAPGP